METPYEIHLVEFKSGKDLGNFFKDEERKKYVHLKEQSIKTAWLIKGQGYKATYQGFQTSGGLECRNQQPKPASSSSNVNPLSKKIDVWGILCTW